MILYHLIIQFFNQVEELEKFFGPQTHPSELLLTRRLVHKV